MIFSLGLANNEVHDKRECLPRKKETIHQPLSMIITNNISGLPEHDGFTSIQFLAISI